MAGSIRSQITPSQINTRLVAPIVADLCRAVAAHSTLRIEDAPITAPWFWPRVPLQPVGGTAIKIAPGHLDAGFPTFVAYTG